MKIRIYKGAKTLEFTFSTKNIETIISEVASFRHPYLRGLMQRNDNVKVIFKSGYSDSAVYRASKQGIDLPQYRYAAEVFFKSLGSFTTKNAKGKQVISQKTLMLEIALSIRSRFVEEYDESNIIDMGSDKLIGKLAMMDMEFRTKN